MHGEGFRGEFRTQRLGASILLFMCPSHKETHVFADSETGDVCGEPCLLQTRRLLQVRRDPTRIRLVRGP